MTTTASSAVALLVELTRRGVELQAHGDRLRFRPVSAVTDDLRDRFTRHKADILRVLAQPPVVPTRPAFRFTDGLMDFGDVCAGWTPAAWAAELRRKADRCDSYRRDVADYYRRWAAHIEQRLQNECGIS
jgi:hypothetical protein